MKLLFTFGLIVAIAASAAHYWFLVIPAVLLLIYIWARGYSVRDE